MKYLILILTLILIFLSTSNIFSEDIYKVKKANPISPTILGGPKVISCIDENNCIFLRTDNNGSGLMVEKTIDGGISWELIYADTSFKSSDSVYYPQYVGEDCKYYNNGTIIIVTSMGKIIRSEDFGISFTEFPQIDNYFHNSFIMLDSDKALTTSINSTYYPDSKYQILKSTDGCKVWEDFPVPDSITQLWHFATLMLQKDNSVIIRCTAKYGLESDSTKNYFYHTDFDGSFWNFLEVPKYVDYIYFFDEYEAFAKGVIYIPGGYNDTAVTSKSYDGGMSWEIKSKTHWPNELFSSQLVHNDTNIFISGSWFGFFKSTDKGESWYQPELKLEDVIDIKVPATSIQSYFDIGIVYFYTIMPPQVLKGTKVISSVSSPSVKPKRIYPNPVTNGTDFIAEYEIATSGHLKMYLSDLSGREVCPLYNDFAESGSYTTSFRLPENISSGSYWLVSEQNGYKHVQLLNVVK